MTDKKQPKPLRAVRVEDEIWLPAQERAKAEGTTVSDVIRAALKRYGKKK